MLDNYIELLRKFTSRGYKAYIVGGFVRDYILGNISHDIDIATNATPKEIKEIFPDSCLPNEDYGSVIVVDNNCHFEITTFRKEIAYNDNRRPTEIKYIDDIYEDLLRRDFTINTLCIDDNGEIIDYLGGKDDLKRKIIKSVGNAKDKFQEDSLRMLRAIRFSVILDFKLDDEIIMAIKECKYLLRNLSYNRKKEELDKIFSSPNAKNGIKLLIDLGLEKDLELDNLVKIKCTNSLIGIWSVLDVCDKYPFSNNEKELIKNINEAMKLDNLDKNVLYKYGLYVNSVAGEIKGIDIKEITKKYNDLVIKARSDIDISSDTIMNVLNKEPGSYLKDIYNDLEKQIICEKLANEESNIVKYLEEKYL